MRKYTVNITTDGSGNATVFSPRLSGEIHKIQYVKDGGANPFANGVDFTITSELTGEAIWTGTDINASAVVYPRAPTHTQTSSAGAGAPALYAAGGTGVLARIGIASDRIKIVVAQGGATKVGAFHILVA